MGAFVVPAGSRSPATLRGHLLISHGPVRGTVSFDGTRASDGATSDGVEVDGAASRTTGADGTTVTLDRIWGALMSGTEDPAAVPARAGPPEDFLLPAGRCTATTTFVERRGVRVCTDSGACVTPEQKVP